MDKIGGVKQQHRGGTGGSIYGIKIVKVDIINGSRSNLFPLRIASFSHRTYFF
jgi:hypothetical protein